MTDWQALTAELDSGRPPADELVRRVLSSLPLPPPADYVAFIKRANGAEGPVGAEGYLQLWRLEELCELNREYQVEQFAPGLFLFGSDGGGEAYGFLQRDHSVQIVSVPFVPLDIAQARVLGESFETFLIGIAGPG